MYCGFNLLRPMRSERTTFSDEAGAIL